MSIPRSSRNGETIILILRISDIFPLFWDWRDINNILHDDSYLLGIVLGRLFHAHTIYADHIQSL